MTRGPEGEQDVRDEKGKPITGGTRVKFTGYQKYVRSLMADAGLIDAELEEIVDKLRDVDEKMNRMQKFFGAAAIEG